MLKFGQLVKKGGWIETQTPSVVTRVLKFITSQEGVVWKPTHWHISCEVQKCNLRQDNGKVGCFLQDIGTKLLLISP